MAEHITPLSMLNESLPEMVHVAQYCVSTSKTTSDWGKYNTGGCLGYPGAILLFSIIDSIGSYFRENQKFKVMVDGTERLIEGSSYKNFFVLNSKYFGQSLSEEFIKQIYNKLRSTLVHNAVIGKNIVMIPGPSPNKLKSALFKDENKYFISLSELSLLCKDAVDIFLKDAPGIVPQSKQGKNFR